MSTPIYNAIGKTYDTTRQADDNITDQLFAMLKILPHGRYLDLGCGSGNYTNALSQRNIAIEGIDLSDEMLTKARSKYPRIHFHQGDAKQLPFADKSFCIPLYKSFL